MSKSVKVISFLVLMSFPVLAYSQQYLVVQKRGTVKNIKFQVNDHIWFKTLRGDFELEGSITRISDSSLTIDTFYEIDYDNIATVFKTRSFIKKLSGLFFIRGGIAYTAIVGINGLLNNDSPVIDEQTLIISGSMVAIGFALKPLIVKKMDLTSKWQIKVLDFENLSPDGGW